tara:strand:- start:910 stop:1098 length:189 start_codon:yes stop_codon:yes gene_type:complete
MYKKKTSIENFVYLQKKLFKFLKTLKMGFYRKGQLNDRAIFFIFCINLMVWFTESKANKLFV